MMKPKILLRAMEPEDLDVLYQIENDTSLWDVGTVNVPYSRYVLRDYISNASGDAYADGQVRLMIENAEGEVVGVVDLVNFDARNRKAEVGVVIQKPYRRRGYATEALGALEDYARRVLHIHQLYAFVDGSNKGSLSLFIKRGYQKTAELPDWLYDGETYHQAVLFTKKI
jgi:diamine N-acetyltransferase